MKFKTAYGEFLNSPKISFFSLMSQHKKGLIFGALLLLLTNIISALLPKFTNKGVSLIEENKEISQIKSVIFSIIILAILGFFIRTLSRLVIFNIGRVIERDVRLTVFNRLSILDDEFFKEQSVGQLINYLTTDISNIRLFTGFAVLNFINIIFVFCITTPFLFSINFWLAILALLPFPLVIFATSGLTQSMFYKTKEYQRTLGLLQENVQENLSGAQVVRLFYKQEEEKSRFAKANNKNFIASMDLAKVRISLFPTMRLVMGACLCLLLLMGVLAIIDGQISVGDYVEINARVLQMSWPAMSIGFILSVYHRGRASLSRINELLAIRPSIGDGPDEIKSIEKIDINNLDVEISPKFSLKNIQLSITKGQVLGIVGITGSGKSSLLKILCRRVPVFDGKLFFNKHDVNNLSLTSFYRNVSIVNQEPFLFSKSIKENICLFDENISTHDYEKILRDMQLSHEIENFTDMSDTIIGERGIGLSGGQKQRIAMARALLLKRPVLILDDALSAVDVKTESLIISNLMRNKQNRITIIATSRPSSIKEADVILVMHQGQIIEEGRHEDLLNTGKIYPDLWGMSEKGNHL